MTKVESFEPLHGGPDARGAAPHDFSTNSNACGPCADALQAVQQADASRYPDPLYVALRERLARFHGVDARGIVIEASARLTSDPSMKGMDESSMLGMSVERVICSARMGGS